MAQDTTLVVYTMPDCHYSNALLRDLKRDGISFKQIDLEIYPEKLDELERLTGGERITPVMVEGDRVTVGYNGLGCAI